MAGVSQQAPDAPAEQIVDGVQEGHGACRECGGTTFHILVSVPPPGEPAREAVALKCIDCGYRISLKEGAP